MPHWGYGYRVSTEKAAATAKASLREVTPSPKASIEVCRQIRGMMLPKARLLLEDVVEKRRSVPFRRHVRGVGHRKGSSSGRYPVKAARHILNLLDNLQNNAEFKGLDPSKLRIVHIQAQRGRKLKRYIPRAFGRSSPDFQTLVHVEAIAEEI